MNRKYVLVGAMILAISLSLLSCKSESPARGGLGSGASDLTLREGSVQSGWVGGVVRGVQLLDSTTGTDATQGTATAVISVAPGVPLEAVWAKGVKQGSAETAIVSVATDPKGNIYAVGSCDDKAFGLGDSVAVHGSVRDNVLIVKYDSSGKTLWARSTTHGDAFTRFYEVAVDSSGSAYAAGMMGWGDAGFGDNAEVEGKFGGENVLLVKYDSNGEAQWARTLAKSDGRSEFYGVAVDTKGNVLVVGHYVSVQPDRIDFKHPGPGYKAPLKIEGGSNAILAKFDSSGRVLWLSQVDAGGAGCNLRSVASDSLGNAYVAGNTFTNATYAFGNGVVLKGISRGGGGILVKYSPSGKALWARGLSGGVAGSSFWSVALDSEGSIYIGGETTGKGKYDFGKGVTVQGPSEKRNPLLVKYDASGTPQWARTLAGGSGDFEYHCAAIDGSYVYLTGSLQRSQKGETFDFGGGASAVTEPSVLGGRTEFVVAYDHSGKPQWLLMPPYKGFGYSRIRSILPAGEDGLIMGGEFHARGPLDVGNGITVEGSSPTMNLFVAMYRKLAPAPEKE